VRLLLRLLLSLVIAAVLLALLFHWGEVSLGSLVETWRKLPALVYLEALAVHIAIYALRTLRFRLLLPPASRSSFGRMLGVSAAHNLAAYVLPAKTGEATLVLYLKKVCGVPGSEGLASLVVSRLLDLATLCGFLGLGCLHLRAVGRLGLEWLAPLGGALVLGSAALFVLSARSDWLVPCFVTPVRLLRLGSTRLGAKLVGRATEVGRALRHAGGEGRLVRAALVSVPLWLGVFLFFLLLAGGFGLRGEGIGPVESLFGASWAMLANLLPINGFAGAGTQELGWAAGFVQLGVERDVALSTGVGAHLVQLVNVVGMGVLGHLAMAVLGGARARKSGRDA